MNSSKGVRAVLNVIGKMLKAKGWSKHSKKGLRRRQKLRQERRKLLSRTFSRTLIKRLHDVGNS